MYRAKTTFADLQDGKWLYHEGDVYPRDGLTVSDERLAELAGSDNLARRPLIELLPEQEAKPAARKRVKRNA